MFVELHDRALAAASAISFARVALRLFQCGVTERGHYVVRAHAGIGEEPTECLT